MRAGDGPEEPRPVEADLALTRGIWAVGRVVDGGTGEPRVARVEPWPFADNPFARRDDPTTALVESGTDTAADGRFRLLVCPGPGLITARVLHPNNIFWTGDGQYGIGSEAISGHRDPAIPGAIATLPQRLFPQHVNTIAAIDPAPEADSLAVSLAIQPSKTRSGTVVDGDGRPVRAGVAASNLKFAEVNRLRDEHFTVQGLTPGRLRRVLFRRQNPPEVALLEIHDGAGPPLVATFRPSGSVKVEITAEDGSVAEGDLQVSIADPGGDPLFSDGDRFATNRGEGVTKVARGQFEVAGLAAELEYNLSVRLAGGGPSWTVARGIRVQPGQRLDLGVIWVGP